MSNFQVLLLTLSPILSVYVKRCICSRAQNIISKSNETITASLILFIWQTMREQYVHLGLRQKTRKS